MHGNNHSSDCKNTEVNYFTSGCSPLGCDYYTEAVKECKDNGEHFRQLISDAGYDICYNCGVKA